MWGCAGRWCSGFRLFPAPDLPFEILSILDHSLRQHVHLSFELIDHAEDSRLRIEVAALEGLGDGGIVLLAQDFQLVDLTTALQTADRISIDPEEVLLIPHLLL